MIQILLHHPQIPYPNNITLSQHGSKMVPMPPLFYLACKNQSVITWSMISTSTRTSNLGSHKIMQPPLFKTSTRIHIIWLTTSNSSKDTQHLEKILLQKESKSFRMLCHNTYQPRHLDLLTPQHYHRWWNSPITTKTVGKVHMMNS